MSPLLADAIDFRPDPSAVTIGVRAVVGLHAGTQRLAGEASGFMGEVDLYTILKSIAAVLMFPMSCMALPTNGPGGAALIFGFGGLMLLAVLAVEAYWGGPAES